MPEFLLQLVKFRGLLVQEQLHLLAEVVLQA